MEGRGTFQCDPRDRQVLLTCDCPCDGGRQEPGSSNYVKTEQGRRRTFPSHSLPYTQQTIHELSRYGFEWVYDRSKLGKVKCVYCKLSIEDWDGDKLVFHEHLSRSPDCPLLNHQELLNLPLDNPYFVRRGVHLVTITNCPKDRELMKNRAATFPSKWTSAVPIEDLARYGFVWQGFSDLVRCDFCELKIENWQRGDLAAVMHYFLNPSCNFLKET